MALVLHSHPLASFCQKVLVGLYELEVPFTARLVDLANPVDREALQGLWPVGKFPVLEDPERGEVVPESTIILEYLAERFSDRQGLVPRDPAARRGCRIRDRFYDAYVSLPMQKIVTDKLRPETERDAFGVAEAKGQLESAYAIADRWLADALWAAGADFTIADCAAAPALFYANQVKPFASEHVHLRAYFDRLRARPSFARVLEEAKPYWSLFPG
jgi:glutathione S-transferase